jgi:4,5-DOPA dioxygenase extradiol
MDAPERTQAATKPSVLDVGAAPMPVLFIGHGSPMHAIQQDSLARSLRTLALGLPLPRAIVVVSAHWVRNGMRVTTGPWPKTIHDFVGFPEELYEVEYPAPGNEEVTQRIVELTGAYPDDEWGLDHGAWSVIRHMYPDADIPVIEFALDVGGSPVEHAAAGRLLAPLRDEGVLIVGSGNIVHNLQVAKWGKNVEPYPWAVEFDAWVRDRLIADDEAALIGFEESGYLARTAHPTREHYLPLLYCTALRRPKDKLSFFHEGMEMGSISMRGVRIG